jgi:DNA polymerase III gamma/tau subunit
VKKLEIPPFSAKKLFDALKDDYTDLEKLKTAISFADGTVGKVIENYDDDNLQIVTERVVKAFLELKSSKDVLEFIAQMNEEKIDFGEFLSVYELAVRDLLVSKTGGENLVKNKDIYNRIKSAPNFSVGAMTQILEKISQANERKKANANAQMLVEWFLFQVLEAKFKWQKL